MAEPSPAVGPQLTPDERALLEKGVAEFNARLFYECHDTLEELWSGLRGPERGLVQGLIQVAVGFYHLGNGNRAGAVRLFERGLQRLAGQPARGVGLDLAGLRAAVASWRDAVVSGGALPVEPPTIARAPRETA